MKLLQLDLNNFQSYTNERIVFEEGVSILYGSNGAGKTSILRAIFLALFQSAGLSEVDSSVNIADLVTENRNKGSVTLEFEVDGNEYTVYWSIQIDSDGKGSTDTCVLKSDHLTENIEGVRDVSEAISELLQMDSKAFVNSVYVQQEELMKLLSASTKEKKKIFDNLLGLSQIDTYIERLHEVRREVQSKKKDTYSKIEEVKRQLDTKDDKSELQSSLAQTNTKIETKQEEIDTIITELSDLKERKSELLTKQEETEELESEIEELENSIDTYIEKEEKLEQQKTALKQEKSSLNSEIENLKIIKQNSEYDSIETITNELEETETGLTVVQEKLAETREKIATLEQKIEQKKERKKTLVERLEQQRTELEEKQNKLQSLQESITEYSQEITELKQSVSIEEPVEEELTECQTEIDQLKQEKTECKTQLKRLEKELEDAQDSEYTTRTVSRLWIPEEISIDSSVPPEQINPVNTREIDLSDQSQEEISAKVNFLEDELDSRLVTDPRILENKIQEKQNKLKSITNQIQELKQKKDLLENIVETKQEKQNIIDEKSTLQDQIEKIEVEIADKEEDIESITENIAELQEELTEAESKKNAFKNQIGSLENKITTLKELKETFVQIDSIESEIENKNIKIDQIDSQLDEILEKIDTAETEIIEMEDKIANRDSHQTELSEIKSNIQTNEQRQNEYKDEYNTLLEKKNKIQEKLNTISELENRKNKLDTKHTQLSKTHANIETVIENYTSVKENFREESIALVEYYSNEIFTNIYQNQTYSRLSIDQDYNVSLIRKDNTEIDPKLASGGESAIINMAIRAGIYRTIAERQNATNLPPFILDEPTTFLDKGHIKKLNTLINTMQEWDVPQIFIVTHDEQLIDTADTTLYITKENDVSTIEYDM